MRTRVWKSCSAKQEHSWATMAAGRPRQHASHVDCTLCWILCVCVGGVLPYHHHGRCFEISHSFVFPIEYNFFHCPKPSHASEKAHIEVTTSTFPINTGNGKPDTTR